MSNPLRELDIRVAVQLMGYARGGGRDEWLLNGEWPCHTRDIPLFSKHIDSAWTIIEKLQKRKYVVTIQILPGRYSVSISRNGKEVAKHESANAPTAICLAALEAAISENPS